MINKKHLEKFKMIVNRFNSSTKFPKYGRWHNMNKDEIWKTVLYQIVVVGNSAPQQKMEETKSAQRNLKYEYLLSIPETERVGYINKIFREYGVRYTARNPLKCKKSKAVANNLIFLSQNGGPKYFIKEISKLNDDYEKIKEVTKSFSYIKLKGTRDLLIELGVVKDAIAFDSRLQNIFTALSINTPSSFTSKEKVYHYVEKSLIDKICTPLKITGSSFDRILFQHYDEILEMFK